MQERSGRSRLEVGAALACLVFAAGTCAGQERQSGERDASVQRRRSAVVEVFERARDAVVNISTTRVVRFQSLRFESMFDEMFDFARPRQREQRVQSVGSGFVIHESGFIVTNYHVIAQTSDINAIFADKTSRKASVVAVDPEHDLAVLKVETDRPLAHLHLGRSDDLMIGETVIAIGNPLGLTHTVTSGIVSALDRDIPYSDELIYRGLIQTDAAINPGNSGGPLLNVNGDLIGINSAIRGDAQNVGFAIPVDGLWRLLPSMLDIERRERVRVGMRVDGGGARVSEVRSGSPAARAGVREGDRILRVDSLPVRDCVDYYVHLLSSRAGERVRLVLSRGEREIEATLSLEAVPPPDGPKLALSLLGLTLTEIPETVRRRYNLDEGFGVFVQDVDEASPARRYIAPGDLIVQVNQLPARSTAAVGLALEDVRAGDVVSVVGYRLRRDPPTRWHVPLRARGGA